MVQIIFVVIATADAASCSSAEQAAMQKMDAQTFGDGSGKCCTSALGFTCINHDKFNFASMLTPSFAQCPTWPGQGCYR